MKLFYVIYFDTLAQEGTRRIVVANKAFGTQEAADRYKATVHPARKPVVVSTAAINPLEQGPIPTLDGEESIG